VCFYSGFPLFRILIFPFPTSVSNSKKSPPPLLPPSLLYSLVIKYTRAQILLRIFSLRIFLIIISIFLTNIPREMKRGLKRGWGRGK